MHDQASYSYGPIERIYRRLKKPFKGIKNILAKAQARTHEALAEATEVHSMRLAAKMHRAVLSIVANILMINYFEHCSRRATSVSLAMTEFL